MIFQHTHHLVLSGQKTRTSRPMRDGDCPLTDQGRVYDGNRRIFEILSKTGRVKYRFAKIYAVQAARGKPEIARIQLLEIEPFIPAQITIEQANAEGFQTISEFIGLWEKMYGWEACGLLTWGLRFELVK